MHPSDATLNDYVDDGLAAAGRSEVDVHLRACEVCRATLADLRALGHAAAALDAIDPPERAWTRIERALRESPAARRQSQADSRQSSVWRLRSATGDRRLATTLGWFAAAAVLVLAAAAGLRLTRASWTETPPAATVEDAPTAQTVEAELRQAEEHYQKAIAGLEQIANAEKSALDPNTAATLQKNLAVVDQAISESRAALRAQPTSEPAQGSLLENFKAKIALLQDTVALINEMRKGDEAGTARVVSGLKRGT